MRRNCCSIVCPAGLCRDQEKEAKRVFDGAEVIFVKHSGSIFAHVVPIYAALSESVKHGRLMKAALHPSITSQLMNLMNLRRPQSFIYRRRNKGQSACDCIRLLFQLSTLVQLFSKAPAERVLVGGWIPCASTCILP